jgi:hypothetical protein
VAALRLPPATFSSRLRRGPGSPVAYSLSIAVVDVLGFSILEWPASYNCFGFSPMSVMAAFGANLLLSWRSWRADARKFDAIEP